jgi:hypothetical protein
MIFFHEFLFWIRALTRPRVTNDSLLSQLPTHALPGGETFASADSFIAPLRVSKR